MNNCWKFARLFVGDIKFLGTHQNSNRLIPRIFSALKLHFERREDPGDEVASIYTESEHVYNILVSTKQCKILVHLCLSLPDGSFVAQK